MAKIPPRKRKTSYTSMRKIAARLGHKLTVKKEKTMTNLNSATIDGFDDGLMEGSEPAHRDIIEVMQDEKNALVKESVQLRSDIRLLTGANEKIRRENTALKTRLVVANNRATRYQKKLAEIAALVKDHI